MNRRVYLLGAGLALVALALCFTDLALSLQPGVTEGNVKRIREGMTLAEVEALLGGPADTARAHGCPGAGAPPSIYCWKDGAGTATVVTRESSGRVIRAEWAPLKSPPGPFTRLRTWLGW